MKRAAGTTKMSNNITVSEIAGKLLNCSDVLLLCHTNPDEDTAGSAYALCLALESAGKKVRIACDKKPPRKSAGFIDASRFENDLQAEDGTLVVSVDVASVGMLGSLCDRFSQRVDIRIDHHAVSEEFAHFNYNRPDASATALIAYEIITEMGVVLDGAIASSLYAALAADTGGFRYSNTTAQAHRVAADLIEHGAEYVGVSEALFETKTRSNLRAYRLGIEKLDYLYGGRAALLVITNDDKRANSLTDEDLDALSSLTRQSEGTELGLLLKQSDENEQKFKLSLRSRSSFDCAEFCSRFGGGGHVRAAGASIYADSPEQARRKLLALLSEYKV